MSKICAKPPPIRSLSVSSPGFVRIGRVDVDVAAEEDRADLHVLERVRIDRRIGDHRSAVLALHRDRAVAVDVRAVRQVEREHEQAAVRVRAVDGAGVAGGRAVELRERDHRADVQQLVVRVRRVAAVGDEVEAVVRVDAEPEVHPEVDEDLRREARVETERRDAEVDRDRRADLNREDLAELDVELDLVGVEDVDDVLAAHCRRTRS